MNVTSDSNQEEAAAPLPGPSSNTQSQANRFNWADDDPGDDSPSPLNTGNQHLEGGNMRTHPQQPSRSQPSSPPGPRPPFTGSPRRQEQRRSSNTSSSSPIDLPPRACKFFWTTGRCSYGFSCRYSHIDRGSNVASTGGARSAAMAAVAPFLSTAGTARLSRSGTNDSDVPLANAETGFTPNEAQRHLQKFLRNGYRFWTSAEIYGFVKIMSNATEMNPTWTSEEAQMFLTTMTSDNAILLINEILKWESVSIHAGLSRNIMSFQRGLLPLLRYYSSSAVVKSTLSHSVNALYMRLMDNFEHFVRVVEGCMNDASTSCSFKDNLNQSLKPPSGISVLVCLADVLYEFITRIKDTVVKQPKLVPLIRNLEGWTAIWERGASSTSPDLFNAAPGDTRRLDIENLNGKISRLLAIIRREENKLNHSTRRDPLQPLRSTGLGTDGGVIAALRNAYEGPGELRKKGPRHDNDFVDIQQIRIVPTNGELKSRDSPYLPANLYDAPHTYPAESMERLLDIQFRLLREELTAPLRTAVQLVQEDLDKPEWEKSQLSTILSKHGGKYRGQTDNHDSIFFDVYTNVEVLSLVPDRRGISLSMSFDAPPGRAQSSQNAVRENFWRGVSGKRLVQGGLIALIWRSGQQSNIYLGTVASSLQDLLHSAKSSANRVSLRAIFYDQVLMQRTIGQLERRDSRNSRNKDFRIMIEAPVMFESIRPFLEALRVEPESLPFARYLVHHPPEFFLSIKVGLPKYAMAPDFYYQLAFLFPSEAGITDFKLFPADQNSVAAARQVLRNTRLDPSQAEAVVDTLTREISLIQGPPGTGKSYTGVELIRILLKNKIKPILMIAFTNHALDHMLRSVLDAEITQQIVRLGSRSSDEIIGKYSLENMEMVAGQSRLDRTFGQHYRALKDIQTQISELVKKCSKSWVDSKQIQDHIEIQCSEHFEHLLQPPPWIQLVYELSLHSDDDVASWKQVGKNSRKVDVDDNSIYGFWKCGGDLDFLYSQKDQNVLPTQSEPEKPPNRNKFQVLDVDPGSADGDSDSEVDEQDNNVKIVLEPWEVEWPASPSSHPSTSVRANIAIPDSVNNAQPTPSSPVEETHGKIKPSDFANINEFLAAHGHDGQSPHPSSNRSLDVLVEEGLMWSLSLNERERLHDHWTESIRASRQETQFQDFQSLSEKHARALNIFNEARDEIRRNLLRNVDILGCTTTGAAKLTNLLKGLSPRVMLVEEGGQVLEAHILGSLVPSVEHLILIGDPLQLRPTINNFSLSMDNWRGRQLYRFDMSLMERLATSALPMSQISTQRRMRPTIANLVRNTLYPKLEDHDLVKRYPDVRGLLNNVFFFSHSQKENGGEDSGSKFNLFEVDMIKDLVLYLLRQGCYSQEGDIVVLCAYLGQLAKVRDALHNEVAVVIDERDQAALEDQEGEDGKETDMEIGVEHVKVSQRVRLRTVDNYQGEEAKIVILSLVRNSGSSDDDEDLLGVTSTTRANIGFLKSRNRTNVALSRAKEGLYILGNAVNMASRSPMWQSVIEELEKQHAVGDAFPIVCNRHPDAVEYVSKPGVLRKVAPDGGCMKPCQAKLKCGHLCPYKCHPDDPNHVAVTCVRRCGRLCSKGHPCSKQCADQCGDCMFPGDVQLPCGHVNNRVPCHLWDDPEQIFCEVMLERSLSNCKHDTIMKCSADPKSYRCKAICGGIMSCCGRNCASRCHECQELNPAEADQNHTESRKHRPHPCQKPLFCEHKCRLPCSQDHQCATACKDHCRQQCPHSKCRKYCSDPCSPCQELCTWKCPHLACPVSCGSICARLPCDQRCDKTLDCGHRCPSVCGEPCSIQVCPICATDDQKSSVVDMVLYRTLGDVDVEKGTLDELLIRIPNCQHVFTVETLDGICRMTDYYRREGQDGKWLSLEAPEIGFQKPPVCPTCRVAITSPRYGRIFKRADLDVLELNVASRSCQSLNDLCRRFDKISKSDAEASLRDAARNLSISSIPPAQKAHQSRVKKLSALRQKTRETPISYESINPRNKDLYDISPAVVTAWQAATDKLEVIYKKVCDIAAIRSAHIVAWESAFSYLYQHEMVISTSNPSHAPRKPEEHAMRIATFQVGQSKPRADKKYAVEAILLTIHIRFILVDLALTWMTAVKNTSVSYPPEQLQKWASFGLFVIDTCIQDARLALDTATESESRQQMTRSFLSCMQAEFERFRYNVEMLHQNRGIEDQRSKMADEALQKKTDAQQSINAVLREHLAVKSGREEEQWLQENFTSKGGKIIDEWQKIERSLRQSTFYQAVSLEERISVVKAFSHEFSHTGHFYRCRNGHVFVIGECGGAVESARCHECGERIGGSGHSIDSTNTHAMDLERIARDQGAHRSPWAWGPGI